MSRNVITPLCMILNYLALALVQVPTKLVQFQDGDSLSQGQMTMGEDGTLQVISGMDHGDGNNQVVLNQGWLLTYILIRY